MPRPVPVRASIRDGRAEASGRLRQSTNIELVGQQQAPGRTVPTAEAATVCGASFAAATNASAGFDLVRPRVAAQYAAVERRPLVADRHRDHRAARPAPSPARARTARSCRTGPAAARSSAAAARPTGRGWRSRRRGTGPAGSAGRPGRRPCAGGWRVAGDIHRPAADRRVEPARDRQQRVAHRLQVEPAAIHPPEQPVLRIDGAGTSGRSTLAC